jgi:hypothetical protein
VLRANISMADRWAKNQDMGRRGRRLRMHCNCKKEGSSLRPGCAHQSLYLPQLLATVAKSGGARAMEPGYAPTTG